MLLLLVEPERRGIKDLGDGNLRPSPVLDQAQLHVVREALGSSVHRCPHRDLLDPLEAHGAVIEKVQVREW